MMQLCRSYHGLAVFFRKNDTFTMSEYDCCIFRFPFKFGLQVRYPDKILIILPRTFQINGDRTKQTSLMLSIPLYNRHLHRYRLFPLTQHFYGYFQTLHVSIESDLHRSLLYKILKIKGNCFYLTDLSKILKSSYFFYFRDISKIL